MTLQNRVTPEGEIVAVAARGTMMGNRGGALHDAACHLGKRRWVSKQWICCRLAFNDRHRQVMAPNRYTELFFLDEATALAAGHRPCFECRRQDFLRFAEIWAGIRGHPTRATAAAMDAELHRERVGEAGIKPTWHAPLGSLPPGCFVRIAGSPHLVLSSRVLLWTPSGYVAASVDHADTVEVLTPHTTTSLIAAGYAPQLHPTASGGGS